MQVRWQRPEINWLGFKGQGVKVKVAARSCVKKLNVSEYYNGI